jgi:thioredoxin 1
MVIDVNDKSFQDEVLNSKIPVIVDFWAEWCGPCRNLAPILKDISSNRADIKIVKINVDDNSDLSVKYRIQSIPTMIFINNGEVKSVKVGFSSAEDVNGWIDENLL